MINAGIMASARASHTQTTQMYAAHWKDKQHKQELELNAKAKAKLNVRLKETVGVPINHADEGEEDDISRQVQALLRQRRSNRITICLSTSRKCGSVGASARETSSERRAFPCILCKRQDSAPLSSAAYSALHPDPTCRDPPGLSPL